EAEDVGLGDEGDLLAVELLGVLEGVADRALDAAAGGDLDLVGDLVAGALVEEAAVAAVEALSVLADDHHVDVVRAGILQGRGDAGEQLCGTEVDVLVELEAHLEEDFSLQDAVGDLRGAARVDADGAEEDGVVGGE